MDAYLQTGQTAKDDQTPEAAQAGSPSKAVQVDAQHPKTIPKHELAGQATSRHFHWNSLRYASGRMLLVPPSERDGLPT